MGCRHCWVNDSTRTGGIRYDSRLRAGCRVSGRRGGRDGRAASDGGSRGCGGRPPVITSLALAHLSAGSAPSASCLFTTSVYDGISKKLDRDGADIAGFRMPLEPEYSLVAMGGGVVALANESGRTRTRLLFTPTSHPHSCSPVWSTSGRHVYNSLRCL